MATTGDRRLAPSTPQYWFGVVITWAVLASILRFFLQPPAGGPHFAALGISLAAAIGYVVYLKRAGFVLRGGRFTAKQLTYYAVVLTVGIVLLVVVLYVP